MLAEHPDTVAGRLSREDARRSPGCHPGLLTRKHVSGLRKPAVASAPDAGQVAGPLKYQHIMLALVDPSPYFGDGSKQARRALCSRTFHSFQAVRHR